MIRRDNRVETYHSLNIVFLESLPPLPRQHSAAIGCTKNYEPIGMTVHFITLRALKVSYSDVGEREGLQ